MEFYICEDIKSKGFYNNVGESLKGHSAVVPTIVEKKEIYVKPNCTEFLSELGKIAIVSVWSSMMMFNTDGVSKHFFEGIEMPSLVLSQVSYTKLKCKDDSGKITTFKEPGTSKELFLKNLSTLFKDSWGNFTLENTIVVDDSPSKHIMNNFKNVILPNAWSNRSNGPKDTFFRDTFLPWFR